MANDRSQPGKKTAKQETGFYNEDLSRKAVGRLFNDDVKIETKPAEPAPTVKKTLDEAEAEKSDQEYFDYINRTSQRNKKEYAMKAARQESIKKSREESIREVHKEKEEYVNASPIDSVIDFFVNSEARYIIAGIIIFILILFTFLIVKINSTSSKLKKMTEENTKYEEQIKLYEDFSIENDALKITVANLTADIKDKDAKIAALEAAAPATSNPSNPSTPTTPNSGTTTTGTRTHTIVRGDTIWGLAAQYYGESSQANMDKILNANRAILPDESKLKLGMEIKIP